MKRKVTSPKSPGRRKRPRTALPTTRKSAVDEANPEWTPEEFARAVLRRNFAAMPRKHLVSLRLDEDVLAWFRARGKGYQSQMNALLRAYMEAHKSAAG